MVFPVATSIIELMDIIYQSPADLVLVVAHQAIQYPFTRLCSATVPLATGWHVTFDIIGESHCVTLRREGHVAFQEVLACFNLPDQAFTYQQHFRQLDNHTYQQPGYTFDIAFNPAPPPQAAGNQIEFAFPNIWGQTPFTRIQWQTTQQHLRWWTLHTYPEAGGCTHVCTYSSLHLRSAYVS